MSIPKMSTPRMSNPKMSIPIMSTVPKCLFPLCLLCQNVYSHNVYFFSEKNTCIDNEIDVILDLLDFRQKPDCVFFIISMHKVCVQ